MNQLTVTINGTTYENIVIPFKFEEILDEQLDSATSCGPAATRTSWSTTPAPAM